MSAMDNAHALVIGIANYEYINKLPEEVLNDARDIHNMLIDPQHCGYPEDNVQLLLDKKATQQAMREALADLAKRSDEDGIVTIYISSHGGQIETGPHAGEYLLPVDIYATADDDIASGGISGDDFSEALTYIPAQKMLVVFDCCHAGGVGQIKEAKAPVMKTLPESYYTKLAGGRGRAILASSSSDQVSWVMPGDTNSLFSKHLLAGLQGEIASDDGLIRIFDLFEYLQPKVTVDQPEQEPIFECRVKENFPVALYRGGQKGVIPKVEGDFRYDVYVSYAEESVQDYNWVWATLVPRLKAAELEVAVSDDVRGFGVSRVVSMDRGITQSRRTVIVLTPDFLTDRMAQFESVMAGTLSVEEGAARMIPVIVEPFDTADLPYRLNPNIVRPADLTRPGTRGEREFDKLVRTLQGPLASLF